MTENYIARASYWSGIDRDLLLSASRNRYVSTVRFAVMLKLRMRGLSYPRIARALHRSDHTTVINGVRRGRELLCTSPEFACLLERLDMDCPPVAAPLSLRKPEHQFFTLIVSDAQIEKWRAMARAA
jgi:hypothetical protein